MSRRIAIAAALLLQLLGMPLAAQPRESERKIPQLREALQEYREKKDLLGEAITLLRLGAAEADLGNVDNARSNLIDAAKKNDFLVTWMAHFTLSHVENAVGRPKEAIAQIEKALTVIDDASRSGAPFSLRALAASGLLPETIASESNAAWMSSRILQEHLQPITHDLYGSLLTQIGQLEKAEEELNQAFAGSKGRYDFSIAAHFGDLRFRQQRYDEARAHYQEAVSGFAAGSRVVLLDRETVLMGVYDCLTQLEAITDHPERARHWNDKALEIARAKSGPGAMTDEVLPVTDTGLRDALKVAVAMKNVPRQAAIEALLGHLQMHNRKYGSAASHFERSLQLYQSLNEPSNEPSPAEAHAWFDLCVVYIDTGNYAAAENVLGHARERVGNKSERGDDMLAYLETSLRLHRRRATAEELKASVERLIRHFPAEEIEVAGGNVPQMHYDVAKAFMTNDFSRLEIPPYDTSFGTTMRLAEGAKHFQKRDFTKARTIWRDALEKNPGDTARAGFLLMIGLSYFLEGNAEQASHWLADGTAIQEAGIDDFQSEDMVMTHVGNQAEYYNALIESLAFGGKIEQSFEAAERARARAFLRLLGNRRLKPPAGSGFAVVEEAEKLRRKIDHWDKEPQPDTTLANLQQQYEAIQPRVQVIAREYASLTSVPAQQIDAVRKELPENTTLLNYFVTPFGIHTWILDKDTLEHVRLTVSEPQMRRISCWAFELARKRGVRLVGGACSAGSATPVEAYAALIEPLRSKIRKKRLMIVPHGELHYVPFAALYDEKRSKYLIEDYPIAYVPSASTIPFLREKESHLDGGALVLGDPLANLSGADREARKVAEKLHTTANLGEEAQESLLYRLDGKVDLLHIAAHGTYDATNPLFSAIHLAKGNGNNGQLNVDEIQSKLDLSGVNLVVLSACRSGVGKRSGGDEVIGMTRSILYAGSPGVIATLWDISDEATPALIEKFYDDLLAGATAADALRAAQVHMLRNPKFADPRFWAAFFLTGDPQGRWSGQASDK